jgi:hypothetical protein
MELTLKLVFWISCLAMVAPMYMSGGAEGARPLSAVIECNGGDDSVAIAIGVPYQQQYGLGSILAQGKSYGSNSILRSSTPPPGQSSETRASLASDPHSHGYGIEALNTDNINNNNNNNKNNNKNAGETSSVDNNGSANPIAFSILAGSTSPPGKSTTSSATLAAMETVAMDIPRDEEPKRKTRGAADVLFTILKGSTPPPGKSTTTSASLAAMVETPRDRKPERKMEDPSKDGMFSILRGSTPPPGLNPITSSPKTLAFITAPPPQA